MKDKKYLSLRIIKKNQNLYEYFSSISLREFLKTCETHARFVMQRYEAENS
jgi:hypothetical protein